MQNLIDSITLTSLFAEKSNNGGLFTVKSLATNKDYTFKVATKKWKEKMYTHVSVETGYLEFTYLGTYFNGKIYSKNGKGNTPSALAIAFVLDKIQSKQFDWLDKKVAIMHLGCCVRCGRTLTDANSIARGLGSECANYVQGSLKMA